MREIKFRAWEHFPENTVSHEEFREALNKSTEYPEHTHRM